MVADGTNLLFLEDGKDGDVFVTVDDCNGCTWDGENENNLHPEEMVLFDDLLVDRNLEILTPLNIRWSRSKYNPFIDPYV